VLFDWKKTVLSLTAVGTTIVGLTAPTFAATSTGSADTYVVQGNDTFWTISRQLKVPLSSLLSANPAVNPLNLYPGLTIQLPKGQSVHPASTKASVNALSYRKEIPSIATAYTSASSENGWGPVDFFGNRLKLGTVAVDPSVIPLGSTVYVSGYSFNGLPAGGMICHATDTGSAIHGNRIDIFVPTNQTAASDFGFQNVKVYVLK
jgi:3D (Asp-Asp-Asp) domain-containing protein